MRRTPRLVVFRGGSSLVDFDDYDAVSTHAWSRDRYGYLRAGVSSGGTRRTVLLHRLIVGALPGQIVDHKNGIKLDNRRANLRFCTKAQNGWNRVSARGSVSIYKGVFWNKGRWNAQIKANKIVRDLGRHDTQEEAAHAYDDAALVFHGPFAKTNFKRDEP